MDPRAILARILDAPQMAAVRAPLNVYGRAAGGLLARGLAFAALFAAIPTLLLVLGLVGWAAGDPAARDRISATLISTFPPLAGLIGDSVQALSDGAALTSIVGIVGVIWTMSQFYGALDLALARIWSDDPERSMFRRTARGIATVVLLAGSVMGLILVGSLAVALDATSATQDQPVEVLVALLNSPLVLIVLASLVVLLIYRAVPPRTPSWRAAGIPAATVGAVIVVLSRAFVFLVPRLVGVEALAGSLASAFVSLAWLSLTFQALLLGAAWVRVRDEGGRGPGSAGSAALEGAAAPAETGVGRE
jgi:Predicted membrane protein